ncbi:MAG: lipid-binding SYLF domain-containing protein [Opitutaceae bacterium]
MKKLLLLSLLALTSAVAARAEQTRREEYVIRVESCEAILREFMANPETAIPPAVLQQAHALVIVNQFKAGFIIAVKDGYGVIMVKRTNGTWSIPVLVSAGELSLGFQIGANATNTVIVITDDATPRIMFDHRLNIGVDAKAVAGPRVAEADKVSQALLTTPLIVYTKARGLYAGATVKSGWIDRTDEANFVLYSTRFTMPELLYSDWVKPVPEVLPLMDYVKQIAP